MYYTNRYFQVFLKNQRKTLEYIYYLILKPYHRNNIDFKTFSSWAFYRTSPKQILQTYEL